MLHSLNPASWLAIATCLLLLALVDAKLVPSRSLWLRVLIRGALFASLSWIMHQIAGSLLSPDFAALMPLERLWAEVIGIAWWFLGARLAVGLMRLVVVLENRPRETQIVSDLVAGTLYIATAFAVINFVFGVPINGLLATSGVVAIVLGLALQSTLSDVFSGIAVELEHAYKPGDLICIDGHVEGRVVQVTWRSTQIETRNNSIVIVPNSIVAKSRIENRSAPTPMRSLSVTLRIDAAVDPRRCLATLNAAVQTCRLLLVDPPPDIACIGLRGSGLDYKVDAAVGSSRDLVAARTELVSQLHRHLRYAGIALAVSRMAPPRSSTVPTIIDLLAESELFGVLDHEEHDLLAKQFVPVSLEIGDCLIQEGAVPEAIFLFASGTVEVTRNDGARSRIIGRLGPGDGLGVIGLIIGSPSIVSATALTPVAAYRLDQAGIAAALKSRPQMAVGLEAVAQRGQAWLRREAATHEDPRMEQPEFFLARLRMFLGRLSG